MNIYLVFSSTEPSLVLNNTLNFHVMYRNLYMHAWQDQSHHMNQTPLILFLQMAHAQKNKVKVPSKIKLNIWVVQKI